MSGDRHLRVVGAEPPKPRRRKGERTPLLSREEELRFRQAMRNLQGAMGGSWSCLAEAMGARTGTLMNMMRGARSVSGDVVVRAMRASGLSLAELLDGPAPAERCRACGGIKPTRAAS